MINISNITIQENKTTDTEETQYIPQASAIEYKYNEGKALQEITDYVNKTYGEHYSQNKFQATEFIIDSGHGEGFCLGNMLKYTQRYGKKDTPTEWRKDLMKVIHYSIMMLHVHDLQHKTSK
jgi:membrane-anchored protein YejM (alkaline phosphatase superfamily)